MESHATVNVLENNEETWYEAATICTMLADFQSTESALEMYVAAEDMLTEQEVRDRLGMSPARYFDHGRIYVSKAGFADLLSNSTNTVVVNALRAEYFGEISKIKRMFPHERSIAQFKLGAYTIDLYFVDKKLAVLCEQCSEDMSAFITSVLGAQIIVCANNMRYIENMIKLAMCAPSETDHVDQSIRDYVQNYVNDYFNDFLRDYITDCVSDYVHKNV